MLGALFSNAAAAIKHGQDPAISKAAVSLESVQEDIHTRSLLFPDISQLFHSQNHVYPFSSGLSQQSTGTASKYETFGDIDLENPRDVRIIVAQDATGLQPKVALFDSKAVAPPQSPQSPRRPSDNARSTKSSTFPLRSKQSAAADSGPNPTSPTSKISPALPQSPRGLNIGGFDRTSQRGNTAFNLGDVNSRFTPREPVGEMRMLLDCMFGTAPLSYRGDSTKLHVFPKDAKPESRSTTTSPIAGDNFGSWGRAEGRKRSQLAQSYTPGDLPGMASLSATGAASNNKVPGRRTVLITRTFAVNLPDAVEKGHNQQASPRSLESASSFPFDESADKGSKVRGPKQLKSPMYAISIALQIPVSPTPSDVGSNLLSTSRKSRPSFGNIDSVPSSLESERLGSMFFDPVSGLDSASSLLTSGSDIDERVDLVIQRWDIITRVLSTIQTVVQGQIVELLQHEAVTSPPQRQVTTPRLQTQAFAGRVKQVGESGIKSHKSTQRTVQLAPGALTSDRTAVVEIDRAAERLISGLRTPRVVTGQGRWGIWRDEARWVERWAGGKEQQLFFFNLLTAFLGNHMEWLSAVGPSWYRQLDRRDKADDFSLSSRTVIVKTDKAAARRLIFLLSAFLPATNYPATLGSVIQGFSNASSGYSQSLPSSSLPREPSLRRTINRKGGARGSSKSRGHGRAVSFSTQDALGDDVRKGLSVPTRDKDGLRAPHSHPVMMKTPRSNDATRKSSVATASTVTPNATMPHFTSSRVDDDLDIDIGGRRGSTASLASMNLMHTLQRKESNEQSTTSTDSQRTSRWGSLISGFWSNRRNSSTDDSEVTLDDAHGRKTKREKTGRGQGPTQLERMVQQAERCHHGDAFHEDVEDDTRPTSSNTDSPTEPSTSLPTEVDVPAGKDIPSRSAHSQAPLTLSVDESDGVIDVDIQLPNFRSSSFGSSISSPATSGFLSGTSVDGFTPSGHNMPNCPFETTEPDAPTNVAGCISRYNQDFALQAVKPYPELEADIIRSMREEPTPHRLLPLTTSWTDVCSTLIAHVPSFTIKRLRLRRRLKPPPPTSPSPTTTPTDPPQEESLVTEPIFAIDATLTDAIERIIAPSLPNSHTHSTASSSRSSSHHRGDHHPPPRPPPPPPPPRVIHASADREVPRADCQKVVLGALEEIVRSVVADVEAEGETESEGEAHGRAKSSGVSGGDSLLREGVRRWLLAFD
ncbi:MAG: hypothetical protein M1833_003369 [Piccolia ochrophora]|nr:MAG: hypothetical protein M1833_003369 [Piccolia ochrophora]